MIECEFTRTNAQIYEGIEGEIALSEFELQCNELMNTSTIIKSMICVFVFVWIRNDTHSQQNERFFFIFRYADIFTTDSTVRLFDFE